MSQRVQRFAAGGSRGQIAVDRHHRHDRAHHVAERLDETDSDEMVACSQYGLRSAPAGASARVLDLADGIFVALASLRPFAGFSRAWFEFICHRRVASLASPHFTGLAGVDRTGGGSATSCARRRGLTVRKLPAWRSYRWTDLWVADDPLRSGYSSAWAQFKRLESFPQSACPPPSLPEEL